MKSQNSVQRKAVVAAVVPLAAAFLSQLSAGYALAGTTYQLSCFNIGIGFTAQGLPLLVATCGRVNGTIVPANLLLNGISNQDGNLVQGSITTPSTFQQSCGISNVRIDTANTTIVAYCRKTNGSFVSTALALPSIANIDGTLAYIN
jgi:hypothetical protein